MPMITPMALIMWRSIFRFVLIKIPSLIYLPSLVTQQWFRRNCGLVLNAIMQEKREYID